MNASGGDYYASGAQLTTGDLFTTGTTAVIKLGINHYANTNDSLRITGTATGSFKIEWLNSYNIADTGAPIPLANDTYRIVIVEGDATGAIFTADPVESGVYVYDLIHSAADYELVRSGRPSSAAAAILNTASILGMEWHYSLDSLQSRMGDLRANPAITFDPRGNLWLRGSAYHLDAGPGLAGTPFKQDTHSVTAGGDKAFRRGDSTVLGGAFVSMGSTDRDYANGGTGGTDNIAAGLYASWFHRDGWYADAIIKADRNKNKLNSRSATGLADRASYNSNALGFSVEAGRHFEIDFAPRRNLPPLWIEPAAQVAIVWLGGGNYVTDRGIRADLEKSTALQGRLQISAGTV
ncbi:MAG: autotransporter outer membrane beta-barrel domain-containing protein, partial [Opitutaceae bacterium]|nr:autotransporter outer membrane beta-barrel domain-containing protein [Opitutaceae bacterium]